MTETTTDDDAQHAHRATDLETIVVDPDDVIAAMRRNERDQNESRSHVLRVSPPFEGEQQATPHVDEDHTRYPSDITRPLHLSPGSLVVGHAAGTRHPDWRNEWSYPNLHEERSLFRDEFDAHGSDGDNRALTDDEQAEWDEWWETAVEMWEDSVRHALKQTDELTLTSQHPDVAAATVAVRFEGAGE